MHDDVIRNIMRGMIRLGISLALIVCFVCWSLSIFPAGALLPIMFVLGLIGTYN